MTSPPVKMPASIKAGEPPAAPPGATLATNETTPSSSAVRHALARAHIATLLFGVSGLFGRLCQCSASVLVCGRAGFAVAALALLGLQKGQVPWRGLKTNDMVGLVLTGVLLAAHYVTFFMGIQVGGVAVGTLGFACFPAFTTLFESIAYRERPSNRELQCLTLVTVGLVCTAPSFSLAHDGTAGLLLGVISGLAYALVTIANRRFASHLPSLQTTWWQNVVTAAFLLPFTWWQFAEVRALDWLWIACLGLICSALAYVIFIDSLVVLKARQAALIITLEPVYAIFAAWIVLGDVPGVRVILGGGLILGAVLLLNRR
ncbi:DMT family transporter [Desulfovibrio intestinalis]|uniref:Drug/metabolite transporter (DMT)-like permease n=1 Tax=Desulfovibrio intestinalis TaxID=58621 RepID=A0A7W8FGE8_9BACT|nr:EamA family transporter [Desulfovibrio intestinalis]MBB5142742.1 drug/metabolite transporter (DMT)-like permease [Desulfovibrio intestinalis]